MLIPMTPVLQDALKGGYAVGSFNVANFEMMETVIKTAAHKKSPVIVSTAAAEARYFGPNVAHSMAQALAKKHNTPIVLHLDHGDTFELAMQCIRAGYTSVMFDGSHHALEDNIRMTKEVVQAAHAVGVSVEGEVGRIQGVEDDPSGQAELGAFDAIVVVLGLVLDLFGQDAHLVVVEALDDAPILDGVLPDEDVGHADLADEGGVLARPAVDVALRAAAPGFRRRL